MVRAFKSPHRLFLLLLLAGLFFFCKSDPVNTYEDDPLLERIAVYDLAIAEPSGLCRAASGQTLWTVSDRSGKVYQLDPSGRILKELAFQGDDLEGIAVEPSDSTMWVVDESNARIYHLTPEGAILRQIYLDSLKREYGIEGIAIHGDGSRVYLVREKNPCRLIIMDRNWQQLSAFDLSMKDASDISYDGLYQQLWIVSDEEKTLHVCNLEGKIVASYEFDLADAEGVAVNRAENRIYLVSDSEAIMVVLRFRQ
ncbi:hypothetical protein GF407_17260 [candidate division KSB1 bacterium]|nr:hypothetical protein [candidate division KSB1 bacterium]